MSDTEREVFDYGLSPAQFRRIAEMLYAATKITLSAGKEDLVKSRLAKRGRALGLTGFGQYIELAERSPGELYQMVDLLTTNKTSFFRENQHFDFLRAKVLPELKGGRVRIWSAGCSSGEEPYTIAMVLREELGEHCSDVRVLATDISSRVLSRAAAGVYDEETLRDVPPQLRARYFDCVEFRPPRRYSVKQELRSLVSFAPLNLMGEWPMHGPFNVIFCRNVMIYFDKPTQENLVDRFYGLLAPGGYLFVGHSESLAGFETDFRYVQPAVHLREA